MSKIVMCHPDNLELVKKLPQIVNIQIETDEKGFWLWDSLEFRTSQYMEKDRPSGRYILPDGSRVLKEDVVVQEKFEVYGPEDVWYLLWIGLIKEEREPLFYLTDPMKFPTFNVRVGPVFMNPRSFIKFGSC